jgi:hypothetical protein
MPLNCRGPCPQSLSLRRHGRAVVTAVKLLARICCDTVRCFDAKKCLPKAWRLCPPVHDLQSSYKPEGPFAAAQFRNCLSHGDERLYINLQTKGNVAWLAKFVRTGLTLNLERIVNGGLLFALSRINVCCSINNLQTDSCYERRNLYSNWNSSAVDTNSHSIFVQVTCLSVRVCSARQRVELQVTGSEGTDVRTLCQLKEPCWKMLHRNYLKLVLYYYYHYYIRYLTTPYQLQVGLAWGKTR